MTHVHAQGPSNASSTSSQVDLCYFVTFVNYFDVGVKFFISVVLFGSAICINVWLYL